MRRPDRIIVPQYLPPPGLSLVAAAELLGDGKRAMAAQIVDFAVRKVITISRTEKGFRFGLVNADGEGADERSVLAALFGGPRPGAELVISRGRNSGLGALLREPHRAITAALVRDGLATERGFWAKFFTPLKREPVIATPKAYPVVDHLWGIHDYVRLAEKERFALLQSPDGTATRVVDGREMLLLNERLLPYAVLFGLEREWAKAIDTQHQNLTEGLDAIDALELLELAVYGADAVIAIADLASTVDAADTLDGVGAFFGGLGDFLSGLN
ncbi:hypothetical protein [Antiquaquibacter soli]|uniref:Uncharacterized protein n=1 Tax=Antiquaquibacter soli TaxID=3064523 RepID=A0ABT9BQG7_9MICO|nr:hypothetical protein [Protaetiibacter sp. WY-16]MDO7882682.1 hypothetical protein [Protaetiibacter sp. WY-16]